jgi:hypothetical protein
VHVLLLDADDGLDTSMTMAATTDEVAILDIPQILSAVYGCYCRRERHTDKIGSVGGSP